MIFNLSKYLRILLGKNKPLYSVLANPDIKALKREYINTWKNPSIPPKQLSLTQKQIEKRAEIPAISVLIADLQKVASKNQKILEVGCSTGYHFDYFTDAGLSFEYEGCDFSPTFIHLAKKLHPGATFRVNDATNLSYSNRQFDTVISGCCILHIIDYEKAIAETARIAKTYAIFHRTPVVTFSKTIFAEKTGYGVPMLEIFFNENELVGLFYKYGLSIIGITSHGKFNVKGLEEPVIMKNYLCRKI